LRESWKKPKRDEDQSGTQAWKMVNLVIYSWLLNVIDAKKLYISVAYGKTAHACLDNFKKQYSATNAPEIHQLKARITSCK